MRAVYVIHDLWRAVINPLALMKEYREKARVLPAVLTVLAACALNAAAAPAAYWLSGGAHAYARHFTAWDISAVFLASALSAAVSCLLFRLLAAVFRKPARFKTIFATWGVSFFPTMLAVILVEASEAWFTLFIGNAWLGMLLFTLLLMLLAWKAILFFMELGVVLGLKGNQTAWAVLITAVIYAAIMFVGFHIGIKTPML